MRTPFLIRAHDRPSVGERRDFGRQARLRVKRSDFAEWNPSTRTHQPLDLLKAGTAGRLDHLAPIKFGRMSASPFSFYRGAAPVMAADIGNRPTTGLRVQICGDAHVRNLGAYAAPDGHLVFDLNDFDETLPHAPWEWDVLRLGASFVLAGREAGARDAGCVAAVQTFVRTYRESLAQFCDLKVVDFSRFEVRRRSQENTVRAVLQKAELCTPARTMEKLTVIGPAGAPRLREQPPALYHVSEEEAESVLESLESYRETIQADRRQVLDSYAAVDVAFKVVGTGSVGTRVYIILLLGRGPDDPLFLQVKESVASSWLPYLPDTPVCAHEGRRVAEGQLRMQTATDPFLGWTSIDGRSYLVRQLADHKASLDPRELRGGALDEYAFIAGQILAKAHSRTGDSIALAAYCGDTPRLDEAVAGFSLAYADQTVKDHAEFIAAIKAGQITAQAGV